MPDDADIAFEVLAQLDDFVEDMEAGGRMQRLKRALIADLKNLNFFAPWAANGFYPKMKPLDTKTDCFRI